MARPRPPLERMMQCVAEVQAIIDSGMTLKEALAQVGESRSTYYRWRNELSSGEWPAINKDWPGLARTWMPGGGLSELDDIAMGRLRRDVAGILKQIYGHAAPRASNAGLEALLWFHSIFVRAREAYDLLDADEQDFLAVICEKTGQQRPFRDLVEATFAMEPLLFDVLDAREDFALEAAAYGRGPLRDPRVGRVVMAMATIWTTFSGKVPSHTVEPDSQLPVSSFNDFFDSIRRHFLRDLEIADHAVMEAMQHTSARIDWTDEVEA